MVEPTVDRELILKYLLKTLGFITEERGSIYISRAVREILKGTPPDLNIWRKIALDVGRPLSLITSNVRTAIKKAQLSATGEWESLLNEFPLARPQGTTLAFILASWVRSHDLVDVQGQGEQARLILKEEKEV